MIVKSGEKKELQKLYEQGKNQIVVVAGQPGCGKENLFREFVKDKKSFYYRCRQADSAAQCLMMGEEITKAYGVKLTKFTYDEYFTRVKSGDPTKLVIIIDEAQYILKKDPEFVKSLVKLKMKKLYPGPVMVILGSSDLVWVGQGLADNMGDEYRRIDQTIKVEELNFLEVVRAFPDYSSGECIRLYGVLGGVPAYLNRWDAKRDFKENICNLILSEDGFLYKEAEALIAHELRELSVYNTILSYIAQGYTKLNELFHKTGFSRAKISVYMKNLSHFDIVEKLVSFETGGWENAKKGVYQIRNTYVNFWYKFVFPHLSDLYRMTPEKFYDTYIQPDLDSYLSRYFRNVCMEYLMLLDQMGRLPFTIHKMGTWVGKTGNIDIIAQSSDRRNVIGLCNWAQPALTAEMCADLFDSMKKAKLTSKHYYLFSATTFDPALVQQMKRNPSFTMIDMNEL